jgi:hypothetical protein
MKETSNVVPLWNVPDPEPGVESTHWAMDVLPLADDNSHRCIRLLVPTHQLEFLYECLKPFVQRLSGNT